MRVDGERCAGGGEVEDGGQRAKERGLLRASETDDKTASHSLRAGLKMLGCMAAVHTKD